MTPPTVKCLNKIWHPNISEDGDICLSLLRLNSIDGLGWCPTRRLNDIIWGLNSLFTVSFCVSLKGSFLTVFHSNFLGLTKF